MLAVLMPGDPKEQHYIYPPDPVSAKDPRGLDTPGLDCIVYSRACNKTSEDCRSRWRCFFLETPEEEQQPYFNAAGVTNGSQQDFLMRVCVLNVPSCKKAAQACPKFFYDVAKRYKPIM